MRWALLVVPLLGCAAAPCDPPPQPRGTCAPEVQGFVACWHVGSDGQGESLLDVMRATPEELAAVLTAASSSSDYPRTQCGGQEKVVLPLAEMVIDVAWDGMTRKDIKEMVARPEQFGRPDLEGLEVRVQSGCRADGQAWFGMSDFLYSGTSLDPVLSCCIGTGCGAEVECDAPGEDGLPTTCAP